MNNLLSYCGLVEASKSASEKDLPVPDIFFSSHTYVGYRKTDTSPKNVLLICGVDPLFEKCVFV